MAPNAAGNTKTRKIRSGRGCSSRSGRWAILRPYPLPAVLARRQRSVGPAAVSRSPGRSPTPQTRRRSSSTSTQTPAEAGKTTWSPGWTGIETPTCSHQSSPGPTARMIPCCGGGSCVPGGTTRPDRRIRSWSSSLTTTWSNSGRSWWRTASIGSLRERASTALRITTAVHKFGTDLAHPSVVWGGQWAHGLGVAAAPPSRVPAERHVSQARPDKRTARRDARVAERATEEWGVLSLEELRQCGLNREAVRDRVRAGQLHRLHRAVYAVGHRAVSLEGQLLAAVKSLGPDAVLSHFSAAALWGFVDWDGRHPEVTVCRMGARRRAGIRVHPTNGLEPRDVMRHRGSPSPRPPALSPTSRASPTTSFCERRSAEAWRGIGPVFGSSRLQVGGLARAVAQATSAAC